MCFHLLCWWWVAIVMMSMLLAFLLSWLCTNKTDDGMERLLVCFFLAADRLVGLVVRHLPRERKIPGSNSACTGIFRGRVIPVTQKLALQCLPCLAPGVIGSALGLVSLVSVYCDWVICNFYLSVAARKLVWADPSLRYTRMLLGHKATNKQLFLAGLTSATWKCASGTDLLRQWGEAWCNG